MVIGSGLAGLTYALRAKGSVCVLTKGEITDSNTSWAQGGIAAAVGEADDWELHERDTLIAGAGLCDVDAVRFLVQNAPAAIKWLQSLGARFDQEQGDLALGREGGHSRNRIVHHADKTGWEVERAVSEELRRHDRITVFPHAFATTLLLDDGRCVGARAHVNGLGELDFVAGAVMLATGGCGRMYQHTTNPPVATADGIALSAAAGAKIAGMEFMQFHPTTLYHQQMRSFLISEAVRGAGGTLRNHLGRRFMYDYDPHLELAPRDIVARAIEAEMKKHGTWCVYLDTTHLPADRLRTEFPTIYERLASIGIYMEKDWIPVVPAQHYSCGGVKTDLNGQTTVPGLFAAGEVASTGVHGANRLASNSLLEAIVFATAAASGPSPLRGEGRVRVNPRASPSPGSHGAEVAVAADPCPLPQGARVPGGHAIAEAEAIRIRRALQRTMTNNVGIVRTFHGLHEAERTVEALIQEYDSLPEAPFSPYPLETRNLLVAARFVIEGAIRRDRNVGLHFNADLAG